jgi:peptide/nickel transport system permease protein
MHVYIMRRLFQAVPILFCITVVVFFIIRLAPGDPFSALIDPKMGPEQIERIKAQKGFNKPLYVQYWAWLKEVLQGNLGWSYKEKRPVLQMIGDRIGPTLLLGAAAMLISFLLGIPIGIISAAHQNSLLDNLTTLFAFAGISIPSFFFGLLMLKLFALGSMKLFPSHGFITAGKSLTGFARLLDIAHHLVLPALVLGLISIASLMRYVRSSMLEVIRQDYIRTARAKGLSERIVIYKHALRNALIPVITIIGLDMPGLVGGAIITESIFIWPGIGRMQYAALLDRDYPVLMGLNLMFAVLTLAGSLLADIGYAVVDPRIRYE